MIWTFDGSFNGFLCAAWAAKRAGDGAPYFLGAENANLFEIDSVSVPTDSDLAGRLADVITTRCSGDAYVLLRDAWLHEERNLGILYDFILRACTSGSDTMQMLADDAVSQTNRWANGTRKEAHKLLGFLRFRSISHEISLYAGFHSSHRVLTLLVPHFLDRMGDRNWMIHDSAHGEAAVFLDRRLELLEGVKIDDAPEDEDDEKEFQRMWRRYFKDIAQIQRRNSKLQRSLMPKKYHDFLTEIPGGMEHESLAHVGMRTLTLLRETGSQ